MEYLFDRLLFGNDGLPLAVGPRVQITSRGEIFVEEEEEACCCFFRLVWKRMDEQQQQVDLPLEEAEKQDDSSTVDSGFLSDSDLGVHSFSSDELEEELSELSWTEETEDEVSSMSA